MSKKIVIEPVTRIEGHAKVIVNLDDEDRVTNALLMINEFRGFEKFCEGRMFYEMPQITQRICGICPVSHHLASVKACDAILGVTVPPAAKLLRELMHMGQIIQSHSMHFFELAGPDLLLGFDCDPATRNVAGLYKAEPEVTKKAVMLRKFGQSIIAAVGDRRIHPNFAVPGGVNKALEPAAREALLQQTELMIQYVFEALDIIKGWCEKNWQLIEDFASFPSAYLGMVSPDGALELYDGELQVVNPAREPIVRFPGSRYLDYIAERVEPWSYLKFPYLHAAGFPEGTYRVGPLGRLNAATSVPTPLAQEEYKQFHALGKGGVIQATLMYHYARLVEDLYAIERARQILENPAVLSKDLCEPGGVVNSEGVGVIEAPRGTLWHHYQVDENGKLLKVNLIVATGNNNYAMTRAVDEVAKRFVDGKNLTEGMLNRIEAAIRAYDPCLSCSTHAVGQMALEVTALAPDGTVRSKLVR